MAVTSLHRFIIDYRLATSCQGCAGYYWLTVWTGLSELSFRKSPWLLRSGLTRNISCLVFFQKKKRLCKCKQNYETASSSINYPIRSAKSLIRLCCCAVNPDLGPPHCVSKQPNLCVCQVFFSPALLRMELEWTVSPSITLSRADWQLSGGSGGGEGGDRLNCFD